ncbi:MAG: hypothetical protein IKE17_05995, partial [Clostridia bacterium]|nr:hypothetical protein [Clostridia bacterium]
MKNAVKKAGQAMSGSANTYIQSLNQSTNVVKNLDKEIKRLESQMTKLKRSMTGDKVYTAQYNGLTDQIKEAESEIEKLQAKQQEWADMGIDPESEPFTELDNQIFDLIDRVEELRAKQAELRESGEAYTPEYANMQQDLEELQTKLEELKAARDDVLSTPPGWNDMATVTGAIADAMNRVKTSAATALYAIQHPAESLDRLFNVIIRKGVGAFIQLAGVAARAATSIFRIAGSGALSFLKKLAEGAKNAAIQLAKLMGNAVGGGFKKLGGGIWNAVKGLLGFNNAGRQARVSIKQLLGSILSARAIISGFKKIIQIAKESLEDLAKSNPKVKTSLNGLTGALNGLKSSLGTAFAPIFTAVAPALTRLINMLTSAINTIGALIAALTGQKTYQKAVTGLNDVGGAASGASDDVKELKRQLAGFDDLEVLSANDSSSGGGGGGGGGGGVSYETEEIGSGIVDFVAKLKEMWAAADYEGIGREIAGCINNAFEKAKDLISWDNLGDKITEAVTAITGIFNGLVDGIDWELIGETFGEGINTILHTVNLLLTGIDWENLGTKLMEGLNSLVDTVDWKLFGDTLGQSFKAAVQLIGTALETFDWGNLGTKLAEGINALVERINDAVTSIEWETIGSNFAQGIANLISGVDWNNLGITIANSFNAALFTIYGAVHDFDFKSAATDIFNGLNELIVTVDWTKIGETINDTFKGALDFIATAIETVDWKKLGENVKMALVAIDWNGVFESLSEAIGAAAGGLASLIGGLLSEAFTNIKDYFSDSIEAAGGDVVAGVFNGILNAIKNVGTWIKKHIFDPFIDGFKKAFGIASPASTMEEPGENIVLGIFQGIINALKNVGQWVKDNIFTPIWDAISEAGATAIEITVSLVKKVGEWASDVWNFIKSGAETIVKTVSAVFDKVTGFFGDVWNFIKSGAETIVKT